MTREELIADLDQAVADFATQIAERPQLSTGIPKPPTILVTEIQFDPSKTNMQLGEGPHTGFPPEGGGGGGPPGGFVYGACCDGTDCTIKTEEECLSAGGTWKGPQTDCEPNPCLLGACCIGSVCSITTEEGCAGVFQGIGTVCEPNPCIPICDCAYWTNPCDGKKYRTLVITATGCFEHLDSDFDPQYAHWDWSSTAVFQCGVCVSVTGSGTFDNWVGQHWDYTPSCTYNPAYCQEYDMMCGTSGVPWANNPSGSGSHATAVTDATYPAESCSGATRVFDWTATQGSGVVYTYGGTVTYEYSDECL